MGECQAFLHQGADFTLAALRIKEHLRQLREGVSDAALVLYLSEERQALLVQSAGSDVLTLAAGQQRQGEERVGGVLLVVHFFEERQSFLEQGACLCCIASHPGDVSQDPERERDAWLVSELPIQRQAL